MATEEMTDYVLEVVLKDRETLDILSDGGYELAVGLPRTQSDHFRTPQDTLKKMSG